MHQISIVRIENFRSIVNAEFSLSAATALVGYNNAGKTNILRAINWLISKHRLGKGDFWSTQEPIAVTATVTGIDEEVLEAIGAAHRGKIEPLVRDNSITIRRVQASPDVAPKKTLNWPSDQ